MNQAFQRADAGWEQKHGYSPLRIVNSLFRGQRASNVIITEQGGPELPRTVQPSSIWFEPIYETESHNSERAAHREAQSPFQRGGRSPSHSGGKNPSHREGQSSSHREGVTEFAKNFECHSSWGERRARDLASLEHFLEHEQIATIELENTYPYSISYYSMADQNIN